ncbi:MAG: TetR/AcrR family transcriptional regulator [Chloroflexi bacterium]|nr:TetR/AcrR family transcriptional regulator [Chloroflexota bacterium]
MPYHHGDLRRALMDAAVEVIARDGVDALNLRELARRTGVSHAAPAHHFGDRAGLLTAIAAEGYDLLTEATRAAWDATGSYLEVGVAYVRFGTTRPGHFAAMFRPDLVRADDPALSRASASASAMLYRPVDSVAPVGDDARARWIAGVAAWSLVHGLATLWLQGSLRGGPIDDPEALARATARHLFERPAEPMTPQRRRART